MAGAYGRGEHFCSSGYCHGAMQAVVARIGPDKVPGGANMLCSDLGGHERYFAYHRGYTHGLGHGFTGILENELFASL